MTRALIGLGSNLEDPMQQLQSAIRELHHHNQIKLVSVSAFYRTRPLGPQDQPDYINAAAAIDTDLTAQALLETLLEIESRQGRTRNGERWGARVLDLDLLLFADDVINQPNLIVPHPEIQNRAFVLYPLADIDEKIFIPELGTVAELKQAVDASGVERISNHDNGQEKT